MKILLYVIYCIVMATVIVSILLQKNNKGGIGSIGGDRSGSDPQPSKYSSRQESKVLSRITAVSAVIMVAMTILFYFLY